ncbi:MAG: hypothetical protein ACR2O0_03420, partial [Rhizobiaceae bacterium]
DLLFAKQAERGTTLVLVTHDTNLAKRCERVMRVRAGVIESDRDQPKPATEKKPRRVRVKSGAA